MLVSVTEMLSVWQRGEVEHWPLTSVPQNCANNTSWRCRRPHGLVSFSHNFLWIDDMGRWWCPLSPPWPTTYGQEDKGDGDRQSSSGRNLFMSTPYTERDEQRPGGDECDAHTVCCCCGCGCGCGCGCSWGSDTEVGRVLYPAGSLF